MGENCEDMSGACSKMGGYAMSGKCGENSCVGGRGGGCPEQEMGCGQGMGGGCAKSACESTDPMRMMWEMQEEAYAELMVEKMKAAFERRIGKKMDKAAEVVVEYSVRHWASKMEHKEMKMKGKEEYFQKLMEAMKSK